MHLTDDLTDMSIEADVLLESAHKQTNEVKESRIKLLSNAQQLN